MSKYTKSDEDVKQLSSVDRISYETYLLDYDVDENIEAAKGMDTVQMIKTIMKGGKPQGGFSNPKEIYTSMFAILIGIGVICIVILLVTLFVLFIVWLIKKDDISKLYMKIIFILLFFVVGMVLLIFIFTKMKDGVQDQIEKIVYKL